MCHIDSGLEEIDFRFVSKDGNTIEAEADALDDDEAGADVADDGMESSLMASKVENSWLGRWKGHSSSADAGTECLGLE